MKPLITNTRGVSKMHKLRQQLMRLRPTIGGAANLRSQSSDVTDLTSLNAKDTQEAVKPYSEMPGPSGIYRWPMIGTILNFKPFTPFTGDTLHLLLKQMCQTYGPVFRFQLGVDTVVVTDPKDIQTVYKNEGKYPWRPTQSLEAMLFKSIEKQSLTVEQGETWSKLRTPLNKHIARVESASKYLHAQGPIADDFVNILASRNLTPQEFYELLFRFASESMGVVCFNKRLGYLDGTCDRRALDFLKSNKIFFTQLYKSVSGESLLHTFYRNKTRRMFEAAGNEIVEYAEYQAEECKKELQRKQDGGTLNHEEPNLMASFLADPQIRDDQVIISLFALYGGGTDSTAGSLQGLLFHLASNPDKQEILHKEVQDVVGKDTKVTAQHLANMPYLKACVKESFRMHYPVPGLSRILPKDVVLGGYNVPAGVTIFLGNIVACANQFVEADKFRPERWLRGSDGKLTETCPSNVVMPFGFGPRMCIGKRFAEQELSLAALKIVQRLKMHVDWTSDQDPFCYKLFLHPYTPLKFTFTERT